MSLLVRKQATIAHQADDGSQDTYYVATKPNAVDHAVLGKIRVDTAQRAAQLRQQLALGAKELWKAVHACEQMRKAPDPLLSRLEATRSQIKTDFAFLGIPLRPRPQPPRRPRVVTPIAVPASPSTTTTRVHTGVASTTPTCPNCGMRMKSERVATVGGPREATTQTNQPAWQFNGMDGLDALGEGIRYDLEPAESLGVPQLQHPFPGELR